MKRSNKQQWLDEYLPNDEPQGDLVDRANVAAEAFRRRSLDAALSLMERTNRRRRATYRRCKECGKRIPKARLQVLPHTTRCVVCQRIFEQRRKRCTLFIPII
ncbi:MAG: TraR/DksA C4-type zinc finger protein [Anaerolineae bacterium]|nr:TraR/DksA C4-type zinc finger protein [Anaerolineae bacterium]